MVKLLLLSCELLGILLCRPLTVLVLYIRIGCINYVIIILVSGVIIICMVIWYDRWLLLLLYLYLLWVLWVLHVLLHVLDLWLDTWLVAPVSPVLLVSVGILVSWLLVPPLWPSRVLWWPPRRWWALEVFWACAKKTVQLFQ
jgi:hypothetical protein